MLLTLYETEDKETAVDDESKITLTFDMQQCFPTYALEISVACIIVF
jgi:hypothetical protein